MSRLIRMSVLASGSTGNATYVESEKGSLLVDVGLTGKKMEELFSQIDRNIKDLNGILVTHEHIKSCKRFRFIWIKDKFLIHWNATIFLLYRFPCILIRVNWKFIFTC